MRGNRRETGRAWSDGFARQNVGIDDNRAVFGEEIRDRTLPRSDPAGQPNSHPDGFGHNVILSLSKDSDHGGDPSTGSG